MLENNYCSNANKCSNILFFLYIILDFTNDKWSFLYSNFNSTNILISDWKVTPSYKNPIRAAVPHPATGKLGKFYGFYAHLS